MNQIRLPRIVVFFLSFLSAELTQAQESLQDIPSKKQGYVPTAGIKGAVLGSIIHPGFQIGLEAPYKYTQVDKYKMRRTKTVNKERYLSTSLGMYHQNKYHTNYFLQLERVGRRQKSNGFYMESSYGVGVSRTFVHGASFSVLDDGIIEKVSMAGNWYGLASLGAGIGYKGKQRPYSVYLKHQWLFIFPYNAFVTPRPTLVLGVNYPISSFWETRYTYKEKQSRRFRKSKNK